MDDRRDFQEFRDSLPSDSNVNDVIDWIERDDVLNIIGHIGDRAEDSSKWETFNFDITDTDGETHQITISSDDLPNGYDWDDLFDAIDLWTDEYDVDYDNQYGEAT